MGDDATSVECIGSLCRMVLILRMVAVLLTTVSLALEGVQVPEVGMALFVAAAASLVPYLAWGTVGPVLQRHPAILVADVMVSVVLLAVTGPLSPFFYFTLGGSALGGILYRWRGVVLFSAILLAGYWWTLTLRPAGERIGFQFFVGLPALYPITAAAGAAVAGLLASQLTATRAAGQAAEAAAAAQERARLAREMHDSVAKTLHGIALAATALPALVDRRPAEATHRARDLARAAEAAAKEAREIITNFRLDQMDERFADVVRRVAAHWTWTSGTPVDSTAVAEVGVMVPTARYELLCILQEALRNAHAHAAPTLVRISLGEEDGMAVLTVSDDGRGFLQEDLDTLQRAGHFGLVGMHERALRAGGSLSTTSTVGVGTQVTATAPLGLAETRDIDLTDPKGAKPGPEGTASAAGSHRVPALSRGRRQGRST